MHPLENLKKTFGIFISAIFIIILGVFLILIKNNAAPAESLAVKSIAYDYSSELSQIEAKSFYVYDLYEDKIIYAKNEHEKLPLASITKLMTGFVVLDILPDTATVKISRDDTALGSGTGLVVGESWKLRDLLNFSLITSSNDGIHAIATLANSVIESGDLVYLMNERAQKLSLSDTIFINETGLDVNTDLSGAYSSAYDVTLLLKNILKSSPALLRDTKNQSERFVSENNIAHYAVNTNEVIENIPAIIASKTGFTDLAGGNLAVVFDAGFGHPVIAVVLGSSQTGRFSDMEKLVNLTLRKLSGKE